MEDRILFKLKININDLDNYFQSEQSCAGIYQSELIIEGKDKYEISLKIFYEDKEYLGEKLMRWDHKNDMNLLDKFEVCEINKPSNLINIDFSDHNWKKMKTGSSFYNSDLKYFIIQLKGIKKTYKNTEDEYSEFYLNRAAYNLIEMNYDYHNHIYWSKDPYKWEPKNKVADFIKFNRIEFKPEHDFSNSNDNRLKVEIKKKPRLLVKQNNLSVKEIKEHINLLCSIYSFYSQNKIDYSLSRIHTKNELHIEVIDSEESFTEKNRGIFMLDFFNNPLNIIENIDSIHLLENLKFVLKIIERFNFALKTEGESRFMILYNILEQIRNEYVLNNVEYGKSFEKEKPRKVIETYKFNISKGKTKQFIKETLRNIGEIISDEHKELFINELQYKIKPIMVLSMTNQFKSFFEYIDIDPNKFNIDFIELKSLRDSIFHGSPLNENQKELEEINRYKKLPRFVGIVMLKYFGIKEISDIKDK